MNGKVDRLSLTHIASSTHSEMYFQTRRALILGRGVGQYPSNFPCHASLRKVAERTCGLTLSMHDFTGKLVPPNALHKSQADMSKQLFHQRTIPGLLVTVSFISRMFFACKRPTSLIHNVACVINTPLVFRGSQRVKKSEEKLKDEKLGRNFIKSLVCRFRSHLRQRCGDCLEQGNHKKYADCTKHGK